MKHYSLTDFSSSELNEARNIVANNRIELYNKIRIKDAYASHVTEDQKDKILEKSLVYAEEIRRGEHDSNLTIMQLLLLELTGECIPILKN